MDFRTVTVSRSGPGSSSRPMATSLTNYHVVGDADAIQVHFSDRRTYDAKGGRIGQGQ